jgi:uncharacterized protein YfiM (DUF2279 family)
LAAAEEATVIASLRAAHNKFGVILVAIWMDRLRAVAAKNREIAELRAAGDESQRRAACEKRSIQFELDEKDSLIARQQRVIAALQGDGAVRSDVH